MLADRAGRRKPEVKFGVLALGCVATCAVFTAAFVAPEFGLPLSADEQFALIAVGGFLMTCSVGPVAAIAIDVAHPGLRATACSVLSLAQNLFGLALGPVIAGALSDAFGISRALSITPAFGLLAAVAFLLAARSYEADRARAKFHVPALASRAPAVS